jgi:hypothetical protein
MNPDGTEQTRLTNYIRRTGSPNWSPDGARIVFNSDADGDQEIYIMNFDGSSQQRLTGNNHDDLQPVWSPDGAKIVFRSNRDGNWEIYTMNSDGTEQTRLTNNPGWDESPAWSPDGKKIIFPSDINSIGRQQIYVMNTDGSNLQRLTNNDEVDQAVSWQSLGPNPSQPWGPMEVSTHNGGQISLGPISVISSSPDYDISGGIIYTRYNFIGDFDVQVDYRAGEGWYDEQASNRGNPHLEAACLGVLADGSSLKMIHLVPPDGSDQLFMWNEPQGQTPSNPATTEAPNQSSGKMRITRNGLELEFLYISSGTWQSLYTTQEFPRTLSIFVSATTVYTNHTFSTIFENFKVNSNETTSKCLVTLEAGPGGSITPTGIHQYNINDTLTITAIPDEGCQFLRWETENSSIQDPYSSSTTLKVMGGTVKAIFTDASPPTLSLETPANGGLFWGEDVLISGVFYDRTGINAESVKLVVDGTKVTSGIYMGEGLILYYTNYSIGTHVAQLTVEDVSGNTATASTSFTVIPIGSLVIPIIVAMYMILILYLAIAKK